jgi:hypothetical protein
MSLCLINGLFHKMKKLFGLAILIAICGCGKSPTISNPTITQTFQIAPPQVNTLVSGTFTDLSTNPYSITPFSLSTSVSSGTWFFQTGAHDTVEFQVTFSSPCTFSYYLGTSSIPPTPAPVPTPSTLTSTSVATDANGNYTSSQITF